MLGVGRDFKRRIEVSTELEPGLQLEGRIGIVIQKVWGGEAHHRDFFGCLELILPGIGLVAHRQLEAALEGVLIIFGLQVLQDL